MSPRICAAISDADFGAGWVTGLLAGMVGSFIVVDVVTSSLAVLFHLSRRGRGSIYLLGFLALNRAGINAAQKLLHPRLDPRDGLLDVEQLHIISSDAIAG